MISEGQFALQRYVTQHGERETADRAGVNRVAIRNGMNGSRQMAKTRERLRAALGIELEAWDTEHLEARKPVRSPITPAPPVKPATATRSDLDKAIAGVKADLEKARTDEYATWGEKNALAKTLSTLIGQLAKLRTEAEEDVSFADEGPVPGADGSMPDAQVLAQDLLTRIQRLRTKMGRTGNLEAVAKMVSIEQRSIAELARLTGQSASNEAQLAGSPAWLKLRDLLLAALSEHPDAARAVLKLLDEVLP
ncbi:MAG: hypothetical protein ACLP1D_10355 [Xanthobacteraceae bacterium]